MKKFRYILCALTLLVASVTAHAQNTKPDITVTKITQSGVTSNVGLKVQNSNDWLKADAEGKWVLTSTDTPVQGAIGDKDYDGFFFNATAVGTVGTSSGTYYYSIDHALADINDPANGIVVDQTTTDGPLLAKRHIPVAEAGPEYFVIKGNNNLYLTIYKGQVYGTSLIESATKFEAYQLAYADHNVNIITAVEKTCTTDGHNKYYQCSICQKYYKEQACTNETTPDDEVVPAAHTLSAQPKVDPTCTTDGHNAYWYCSACKKYFKEQSCTNETTLDAETLPAAHTLSAQPKVDPTCTTAGNTAYWSCSACSKYFSDEECKTEITENSWIVNATGHDYVNGLCSVCQSYEPAIKVTDENYASLGFTEENYSAYLNYYAIQNATDLAWFRDFTNAGIYSSGSSTLSNVTANAVLINDIDLSSICHAADATKNISEASWAPIYFIGTFDGNNKSITGLYINEPKKTDNALFGVISAPTKSSTVKNLTVDGNVTGGKNSAIIVATASSEDEITNCVSKGSVNGTNVCGGILANGDNIKATVSYCTNYASVTSTGRIAGGVVGQNPFTIHHCVNYGDVTGGQETGGVVGSDTNERFLTPITDCTNYGNVVANGSYITKVGGIAGSVSIVKRCSNYGNVTAPSIDHVGGIAGYTRANTEIEDCLNTGNITGNSSVGGLVGWASTDTKMTNSYSTGKIEATTYWGGLLVGYDTHEDAASKLFYIKGATVKEKGTETSQVQGSGSFAMTSPATGVETADVASGKLAMLLGGSWGQNLENNSVRPQLEEPTVYFCGTYLCNGALLTEAYTNDASKKSVVPAHSAEYEAGGTCTVCGESNTLQGTGTASDPYLISSVAQLEWFCTQSNEASSNYDGCAKLVNDIDMSLSSNASWTPICNSNGYTGTFDGNGHTVKNLQISANGSYAGFFGKAEAGATIKDLTLEGNVLGHVEYMGMIVAYCSGANITNCVTKGSLRTIPNSKTYAGGVVGYNTNEGVNNTIKECINYAVVSSPSNDNVGGIVGYMYNPCNIEECINYGTMMSGYSNVGGITGYSFSDGSNGANFTNCANFGDITSLSQYSEANVGGLTGNNASSNNSYLNCYVGPCTIRGYYNKSKICAITSDNAATTTYQNIIYSKDIQVYVGSELKTLTDVLCSNSDVNSSDALIGVSAAQIAAGEATYMLNGSTSGGTIWTQDLSDANSYPTLFGDADKYAVYKMGYAHGATACSFSNSKNKQNTLHDVADNNGSHDAFCAFTNNGDHTHKAVCSVCKKQESNEDCSLVNNVCTKCLNELLGTLQLVDGEAYTRKASANVSSLTYKRNFTNTTYNALYLPFAMSYSDWSETADVYRLLNIFEHDNDDDGNVDEWVLRVVKLKEGESTKANTPYVIKPKETGDVTITLTDAFLAAALENTYWCASLDYKFLFTGTYAKKAIPADSYFFLSNTGGLQYAAADVTLKPQRWYMGIYDKDTDELVAPSVFNPQAAPAKAIRIICDDEETTGVEAVNSEQGTVGNGKYIENGNIIIVKNGVKYNVNGQMIK